MKRARTFNFSGHTFIIENSYSSLINSSKSGCAFKNCTIQTERREVFSHFGGSEWGDVLLVKAVSPAFQTNFEHVPILRGTLNIITQKPQYLHLHCRKPPYPRKRSGYKYNSGVHWDQLPTLGQYWLQRIDCCYPDRPEHLKIHQDYSKDLVVAGSCWFSTWSFWYSAVVVVVIRN